MQTPFDLEYAVGSSPELSFAVRMTALVAGILGRIRRLTTPLSATIAKALKG